MTHIENTWNTPTLKAKFIRGNYFLLTSPPGTPLEMADKKTLKIINRYKEAAINWIQGEEITPQTRRSHTHLLLIMPQAVSIDINEVPDWNYQIVDAITLNTVANYVMKNGNYMCKEEILPTNYANNHPRWRTWQKLVINEPNTERNVICVYDRVGNTGKTFLANWHACRHKGAIIPVMKGYQDFMRMIYGIESDLYFVDIPRAMKKTVLNTLFAAIETAKGGYSYDERYEFKFAFREPPKVVVFCNALPDLDVLSPDRWIFILPNTNERITYVEMKMRVERENEMNKRIKRPRR